VDDNPSEPTVPPAVEAVPVPMPAAAQVTDEAPAVEAPDRGADDERERIAAALAEHGGIRAAARALRIGESTLRGRLKRHGIEAPRSRRGRKAGAARAAWRRTTEKGEGARKGEVRP
jgi:DNA-binding NtrC family response regulator